MQLSPEQAQNGALALVTSPGLARLLPDVQEVALADVKLEASIPIPRRNIFCVGRNYHAHAKEFSGSVFKKWKNTNPEAWPL